MEPASRRLVAACGIIALCQLSSGYAGPRRLSADALPRVVLWAWERPEDLRQLDDSIGVAFLAQTVTISGRQFTRRPRLQPLRIRPGNPLIAVTRIESERAAPVALAGDAIAEIALLIARTVRLPRVRGVQVDFDATVSERQFYRALLHQVRRQLDPAISLSITALASWCAGDYWLDGLPVDEAIPMLFRMGPVNAPFRRIAISPTAAAAPCRRAVGMSLDEPLAVSGSGRRVYVFNATAWTGAAVLQARRLIQ